MSLQKDKKWAAAYANEDMFCIYTCSGLRRSAKDPMGKEFFLPSTATAQQLGEAVVEALSYSRFLAPEDVGEFFGLERIEKNYDDWIASLVERFGYDSKKQALKNMKHCPIDLTSGVVTVKPTNHEKLEAWSGKGITSQDVETVEGTASHTDIGESLKRAFEKCR